MCPRPSAINRLNRRPARPSGPCPSSDTGVQELAQPVVNGSAVSEGWDSSHARVDHGGLVDTIVMPHAYRLDSAQAPGAAFPVFHPVVRSPAHP